MIREKYFNTNTVAAAVESAKPMTEALRGANNVTYFVCLIGEWNVEEYQAASVVLHFFNLPVNLGTYQRLQAWRAKLMAGTFQ
jgi:hypothetical protein